MSEPDIFIMAAASEAEREWREWIFTFGYGQWAGAYRNCFVRIKGSWDEARAEMVRRFGQKWSMQYPTEEAAGVKEFGLKEIT